VRFSRERWSDPAFREAMRERHRLQWSEEMLAVLRRGTADGASWRALGRTIGVTPRCAKEKALALSRQSTT
jgi:hypothetical protein